MKNVLDLIINNFNLIIYINYLKTMIFSINTLHLIIILFFRVFGCLSLPFANFATQLLCIFRRNFHLNVFSTQKINIT